MNDQPTSLVPADPVFDGELVEDPPTTIRRRFTAWWSRCHWVPAALRSRQAVRQAIVDGLVALLRSPLRYLGAVGRGLLVALRAWRRWVRVYDYRDAAVQSEKLADKYIEIRSLTLFRWKVTGTAVAVAAVMLTVVGVLYGTAGLWLAAGAGSVALAVAGRRKEGSPGRKAVLAGPRALVWARDPQILVDAFRDARLIGKDETLRLVERARRVGDGWAITVDLPATRKATDVIKNRDALASALAVDEVQLIVERVRGTGGHAGRVALWVADSDPYARPPLRTPLLDVQRWDAWRPVPFGRDARDRPVELPLVWTSLLVGAIPRQGKTFAARLAAAGLILDPHTRLYVADFKAGKDWDAAAQVAHRFLSGDEPDHVLMLVAWLVELISDVQARYRRMRELDDTVCPESKVTPEMCRDARLTMPITALFIDEVQVPLEDRTIVAVQGKNVPAGEYIGELLTWLAKKGPAAGIVLVLATQRPDSKTIPSGLRAVLGSRFALRVMDWRDSNIVLGEQMNTRGYDSSRLLASHKGVGILRPDGDTQAGAGVLALTVRTYYMPGEDWHTLCQRGRALREAAGTLTGHATGTDRPAELDHAAVARVLGTGRPATEPAELPEPLAAVVDYLGDDLDQRGSSPQPNWSKHSTPSPHCSDGRWANWAASPSASAPTQRRAAAGYAATSLPTFGRPSPGSRTARRDDRRPVPNPSHLGHRDTYPSRHPGQVAEAFDLRKQTMGRVGRVQMNPSHPAQNHRCAATFERGPPTRPGSRKCSRGECGRGWWPVSTADGNCRGEQ